MGTMGSRQPPKHNQEAAHTSDSPPSWLPTAPTHEKGAGSNGEEKRCHG